MWLLNTLLAAVVVAQTGPGAPEARVPTDKLSQAYALFLEARELEDANSTDAAIATYRRAAELAPQAAEIRAEIALLYARLRNVDEAFREAAAAIALDPDNRAARRVRGLVKADLAAGMEDRTRAAVLAAEAIDDLERVMADRLSDPVVGLTLGRMYVQVGQHAKAIERLGLFLLERPGYTDALLLLADAYEATRDLPSAVEALEGAIADRPDQARLLMRLAGLHERMGQWRDAADVWGRLADRTPRAPAYRTRQATALLNAGNLAAGREALASVTVENPRDIGAWYLLSQIDRRLGNPVRAEESARQITAIDPEDARGFLALAEAKAARKDYRAVIAILEPHVRAPRAEDTASGMFAQMASELASALGELGDHKRAIAVLESARQRDDRNVQLLFNLGAAFERAKRFDDAERTFRGVIAADPEHADALNYLGYMLADRKIKLDEAVTLISRALAIEVDNPSYLDSLGWAYVQQANLTAARDPLQRAAAALPETSVIQDHLAELYFRLELYAEAAAAWDRALTGDRAGVDIGEITKKRNRAKGLSERK
jgi:tetratricopeptide (TPR) repeat protein